MIPNFSMEQLRQAAISFPMFGENFSICPSASFTLFGKEIYLYGVIIALGFVLAIVYCVKVVCPRFGLASDDMYDMLLAAVPLGIIGARLYYCLTYKNALGINPYLEDPVSMLYIWNGGLAIYGGVIGGVIGIALVSKLKKIRFGAMLDVAAFAVLIGQTVGRWGNFFNREAFGWTENINTVFCRMGLTVPGEETFYVHPTFLYESLWNLIGFIGLHVFSKRVRRRFDGQVAVMYFAWYGFGRMLIEGLRTDSLWLIPDKIRISQLLAGITFVAALVVLLLACRKKDRVLWAEKKAQLAAAQAAESSAETVQEAETSGESVEAAEGDAAEQKPEPEQEPESGQ